MHAILSNLLWIFALTALGSAHGTLCYIAARWVEKRWCTFAQWFFWGPVTIVFLFSPLGAVSATIFAAVFLFLPGLAGAYFHIRSGGASGNIGAGAMLMTVTMMLNLLPWSFLAGLAWMKFPENFWDNDLTYIFPFGAFYFPILAPLGVWLWQNCQVRPGIDEAFEDGVVLR